MNENNYSKEFATLCRSKAKERYRINEIDDMHEKTEGEISNAIHAGSPLLFLVAHEVIEYCKTKNIPYGCGYSSRFLLLAYFLGITEVNPLPIHYECSCGHFEWVAESYRHGRWKEYDVLYRDGFDLPDEECPLCKNTMHGDGHNIRENCYAVLSISIPVKTDFKDEIITHLKNVFGDNEVAKLLGDSEEACALTLSDYMPLLRFDLLNKTNDTKYNVPKIYDALYSERIARRFRDTPVDFYMIHPATCFSEFVCRLGISKFSSELNFYAYKELLRCLNHPLSSFYCNKENIYHIPYCIDNLVNELKKNGFQDENIKRILNSEKQIAKKPSELFLQYSDSEYFEKWFAEILDITKFMWDKQSLIAEAIERYKTVYFIEEYNSEFNNWLNKR